MTLLDETWAKHMADEMIKGPVAIEYLTKIWIKDHQDNKIKWAAKRELSSRRLHIEQLFTI